MDSTQQPGMFFTWDPSQQRTLCIMTGFNDQDALEYAWGIYDWHHEYILCLASGIISRWLWPAKGEEGVVARPRQAYLVPKVFLITWLMPTTQPRRWRAPKGQARVVAGAPWGRKEEMQGWDYSVGMLDFWGWLTQPRLASIMHMTSTILGPWFQSRKPCPNEAFFFYL